MNFSKKNLEHCSSIQMMMSKTILTLIMLLLTGVIMAQNGINYKAIIKDTNGNVVANQDIDILFSIQYESVSIYSELQEIVTNNNGIAIATIGDGSAITGTFDTIDWKLRDLELNVQIDFGDGLVDFGNSPFNTVPYAIETLNKEGLIRTNGGWQLEGVIIDGEEGYGAIGNGATDLSVSDANGAVLIYPYGATGAGSFTTGRNTIAHGDYANAMGFGTQAIGARAFTSGRETQAIGSNSTAMGVFSIASGEVATAIGASVEALGNYSTAMGRGTMATGSNSTAFGRGTNASTAFSTAIGRYNTNYGNPTTWIDTDALFQIGNGSSDSDRHDALTVYKNGFMRINSSSNGLQVNSEGAIGINIFNGNNYGIVAIANQYGGYFIGDNAAIFADASINANPDIILGGDSGNANDDGIIASDPDHTGSDIYLRSNDAVVIELDNDDNSTTSSFQVHDSAGDNVFQVFESGNHIINSKTVGLSVNAEYIGLNISNSGNDAIFINNPGNNGVQISSPTNAGVIVSSPGYSGLYVVDAGDFGADIAGNTAGLTVSSTTSSNPDIILRGNSSANASDDGIIASDPNYAGSDIYLRSNDAVVIQLDHDDSSNGSFIVRDSDGDNAFSVNEFGNATLSGSLTQNSDRRLKKDIDDLHYGLNEILQLHPKIYHWKNKEQNKKSLGLIAQDVQPIINEIVTAKDDKLKTLGVNYLELIPVLINAIKEQQKIIKNQGSNYEALLSRIEKLETNSSN